MRWFKIYVKCESFERFDVHAKDAEDALRRYHKGEAMLEQDEVESRETLRVEDDRHEVVMDKDHVEIMESEEDLPGDYQVPVDAAKEKS